MYTGLEHPISIEQTYKDHCFQALGFEVHNRDDLWLELLDRAQKMPHFKTLYVAQRLGTHVMTYKESMNSIANYLYTPFPLPLKPRETQSKGTYEVKAALMSCIQDQGLNHVAFALLHAFKGEPLSAQKTHQLAQSCALELKQQIKGVSKEFDWVCYVRYPYDFEPQIQAFVQDTPGTHIDKIYGQEVEALLTLPSTYQMKLYAFFEARPLPHDWVQAQSYRVSSP